MDKKTTTIRIKKDTLERLKAEGKFGESYEDVIKKLLGVWEKEHRTKKPRIIKAKVIKIKKRK